MTRTATSALAAVLLTAGAAATAASASAATGTPPGAPRSVGATAGNAKITVTWQAPASSGSSAITGYTAKCTNAAAGSKSASAGPAARKVIVTGVTNGRAYTCTVRATNAAGTGPASTASPSVTPKGPPTVPTSVRNTTAAGKITVTWKAPASTGGSPVTGYAVSCPSTDGGPTLTGSTNGSTLKTTITGLPDNATYRCSVTATNAVGTSGSAIAFGWAMHAVTTSAAGTATMHFPVAAGKELSAVASDSHFGPDGCANFYTADAQGNQLTNDCLFDDGASTLLDEHVTPTAGTATATVASPSGNTGNAELAAYSFNDLTGTIAADGSNNTFTVPYPAQKAFFHFTGHAGQVVSLLFSASSYDDGQSTHLLAPNGDELNFTGNFATSFMDATKLPVTGTYTLQFDHALPPGGATYALYTVPKNTGPITRGGATLTVNVDTPGENPTRSFTVAANTTVTLKYTGSTIGSGEVDLVDSDGNILDYLTLYDEPSLQQSTGEVSLTQAGTYRVIVDPSYAYLGHVKLTLTA